MTKTEVQLSPMVFYHTDQRTTQSQERRMFEWQTVRQLDRAIRAKPDLTFSAKTLASILLDHFNLKTGQCNPSRKRLMSEAGASKNTVCEALTLLEDKCVIVRTLGGGATTSSYSFPSLTGAIDRKTEGVENRPGPKSDPVLFLDERGSKSGLEGVSFRPGGGRKLTPNKEQNKQENKEQNTPASHGARDQSDQNEGWLGFFDALEVTFQTAGYVKTPVDKGRLREWEARGYKPAICLAVVRTTVARNKTIKTLSWFDQPLEKAHKGSVCDPRSQAIDAGVEQVRIYAGTAEADAWKAHDKERSRPFKPFMHDPTNERKYANRASRWPPGHASGLKDAGHVAAELEVIAQGRGR